VTRPPPPDTTTRVSSLTPTPPAFTRQGRSIVLIVVGGPDVGRVVTVGNAAVVLGTAEDCDLTLADATVSRRHLEARWDGRVLQLVDLGSKNGSFVGGERFDVVRLALGDDFVVGKTVVRALPQEEALEPLPLEKHSFGGLVGRSAAMRRLFAIIEQVAPTTSPLLIEGETGVGKERVADEIHRRSDRRDGSATCAAPSPAPRSIGPASSTRPTAAPCSSTRSASSGRPCSRPCCARSTGARSDRWGRPSITRSTCASWPRPTATCRG
jgi:hypothetical protein